MQRCFRSEINTLHFLNAICGSLSIAAKIVLSLPSTAFPPPISRLNTPFTDRTGSAPNEVLSLALRMASKNSFLLQATTYLFQASQETLVLLWTAETIRSIAPFTLSPPPRSRWNESLVRRREILWRVICSLLEVILSKSFLLFRSWMYFFHWSMATLGIMFSRWITSYRTPLNLLPPPAILKKVSRSERLVRRVIESFSFIDLALS